MASWYATDSKQSNAGSDSRDDAGEVEMVESSPGIMALTPSNSETWSKHARVASGGSYSYTLEKAFQVSYICYFVSCVDLVILYVFRIDHRTSIRRTFRVGRRNWKLV